MKEVLQQLANLQYIDSRIDEIKQLRGDLPEEILDIETDINRLEARVAKLKEEATELEVLTDKTKLDIQTSEEKVKKYEEQQMAVRNNREYDALTKEIEAQKQIIENSNNRLEEMEKRKEEVGPEREEAEKDLEATKALLADKKESLEKLTKTTEKEEDQLIEKRNEIEKDIEERYLRSYKRLRNGLNNGRAVVAMEKGAALGMALPPQTQVEVRRMNKIIIDEHSGRIVIDPTFFDEAKKQLEV
jgi:hypothetical protein